MNLKRLAKKMILGGPIHGHIMDAIEKTQKNGKPFLKNLDASLKETVTEDMPGTSHVFNAGRYEGKKEGTVEQAIRDEETMQELNNAHSQEKEKWEETIRRKDDIIKEQGDMLDELSEED